MINEDLKHREKGAWYSEHGHQAMYNPNDPNPRMFKVTDKDKEMKNRAWDEFMEGNPSYMYVPLQKAQVDYSGIPNTGDKILNPRGDFKKPTLEQIRKHRDWYLKQA